MLKRIVVCWNGSAGSEAALAWALRLSHGTGLPIEIFDVVERSLFVGDEGALERATTQEEQRLALRLEELAADHPGAVTASALLVGDPLEVLSEQTTIAALVVVGTAHRVGPRLRYGRSLGARLATAATGPVAIVPVEDPAAARQRSGIVVGVDGSAVASRALEFAAAQAVTLRQTLRVVHCWQEPLAQEPLIVPDDDFADSLEAAHRQLLDTLVRQAREEHPALTAEPVLLRRSPVAGLRLESEHAFLLVVGSRRLTGWSRAWLGSVSHGLVLDLAAPTLLIGAESGDD
ncbi:universal stress protein [Cryocola sp. 340MFSha3.1]|uniref:universal stress protein n=1 Tax=Cryocola sp. 340MFSha3.1 TaxID=1169145 RepID=UPI000380AFF9|nr:universal stress protein [Cryocola sp. 340MFSha3.1]